MIHPTVLVSKIYKDLISTTKLQTIGLWIGRESEVISLRETQMINRHMNRYSSSLIIKMQIEATMSCHSHLWKEPLKRVSIGLGSTEVKVLTLNIFLNYEKF